MNRKLFLLTAFLFAFADAAHGEEKAFNLALVDPVQVFDDTHDITGFRFNLLYGKNARFKGLDLGIGLGQSNADFSGIGIHYAGNFVRGNTKGLQFANIVNLNLGNFDGVQFGAANYTQGDSKGLQVGYASITKGTFKGIAIGGANVVHEDSKGFKLAIFNFVSENFSGLQIGLVNIAGLENGLQIGLVNINRNKKPLPFFPFINFSF